MAPSAEIPLVGGVADGESITVELDVNGRPPLTHHHVGDGGLAESEIYELTSMTGDDPPWRYEWRGPAI
ncbi:hypothetical protein GCM10027290_57190 [Micromonospora sonneratiae]|uniref:Multicopper oxidase n=1 Tax=Micromonospora sonneratiae TaxID=1184706 RepID=A0ABW3YDN0_9ACTN